MIHVEQNCTFTHQGKAFTAGGAVVTPQHLIAYPGKDGVLTDWHGRQLGTWKSVASWPMPRSWVSNTMHQIEAVVDGVTYTGRGCGVGMIFRGKRKATK